MPEVNKYGAGINDENCPDFIRRILNIFLKMNIQNSPDKIGTIINFN